MNPLLENDYIYTKLNHIHINKFIKIVPLIDDDINFIIKEVSINTFDSNKNNLFIEDDLYKLKYELCDDIQIDNYHISKLKKQELINKIKYILTDEQLLVLISLMLPTYINNMLDRNNILNIKENDKFENPHACLIVGYTNTTFEILSSWVWNLV